MLRDNQIQQLRNDGLDVVADEIINLRQTLIDIAEMTDLNNPESFAADDRESCLDVVHDIALKAISNKA